MFVDDSFEQRPGLADALFGLRGELKEEEEEEVTVCIGRRK